MIAYNKYNKNSKALFCFRKYVKINSKVSRLGNIEGSRDKY